MTEPKHTAGPWTCKYFEGDHGRATIEKDRGKDNTGFFLPIASVCQVYSLGRGGRATPEAEANACLISAAPDLLAACKFLIGKCHAEGIDVVGGPDEQDFLAAKAAIAKAEPNP